MAFLTWGKKEDELPESFKGKTPAEIDEELRNARAETERLKGVETANAALTTQIATHTSELQNMQQQLAALNARANAPAATTTVKEPTSVLVDENGAFGERLQPVIDVTLQNSARLAQIQAEQTMTGNPKDRFLFNKYHQEYLGLVGSATSQQRCNEHFYYNCFKVVKANHMNEILDAVQRGTDFFSESAGGPPNPEVKKVQGLTEEQKKAAAKYGISEKDYAASLSQITIVSPIGA